MEGKTIIEKALHRIEENQRKKFIINNLKPNKMNEELCEFCGASLKKYWHSITPGLVKVLSKCYAQVCKKQQNIFMMKDLDLGHSEYGNFQKLRFHGLIAKLREDGQIQEREWLITHRGADFLKGLVQIPARVQTFRNRVVSHDEQMVTINDVMRGEVYWEQDFSYDIFEPKQTSLI